MSALITMLNQIVQLEEQVESLQVENEKLKEGYKWLAAKLDEAEKQLWNLTVNKE